MIFITQIIISLCVGTLFIAILLDFAEFHVDRKAKKEKKSIVETGTMFLFFFGYYALVRLQIGAVHIDDIYMKNALIVIGLVLLIIGTIVNVMGRFSLGKNWSNQIKIYSDHTFVSGGMYAVVRHPLYASIIWMFLAGSMIFANYLALVATIVVFIPFMYYRAKQEESLLGKEFKEYEIYQKKVGMFFPKI